MSAAAARGERVCAGCRFANVGPQAECLNCGTLLPAFETGLPGVARLGAGPPPAAPACPSCGEAVGAADRFCAACGARLV
jgi:hypothetical protein